MANKNYGTFKLEGAAEVERMLKALPHANAARVVKNGLRAGARVIRKQAKDNLKANPSIDTGLLAKTLTISSKRGQSGNATTIRLHASGKIAMVVRKGDKKATRARPSKYAHLVEYGTERMPAEPFLRPAVATKAQQAVKAIMEFSAKSLVREAQKLGANAKLK